MAYIVSNNKAMTHIFIKKKVLLCGGNLHLWVWSIQTDSFLFDGDQYAPNVQRGFLKQSTPSILPMIQGKNNEVSHKQAITKYETYLIIIARLIGIYYCSGIRFETSIGNIEEKNQSLKAINQKN